MTREAHATLPRIAAATGWRAALPRFAIVLALVFVSALHAAEVIPPAPRDHFNDYAGLVRRETAAQLNRELADFERATSNQIVVAIFPRMQSDSSVDDYTVRVAERWRVGNQARDNGAVLFVFQQTRDIRIVTGYGLEASLTDALSKRIIENEIIPRFRAGDFDGGLTAGVRAMMAATRNEYRGTGQTVASRKARSGGGGALIPFIVILALVLLGQRGASRRRTIYGRHGRRTVWLGGGGGWGGGFGGGGGGTFSGGGGSFGGGGAGGRW